MEVVIRQPEQDGHSVCRGRWIRELRIGIARSRLDVVRQRILDIGAKSDHFRCSKSVTRKRRCKQGCVVPDQAEVEAGGDRVFALRPCQIVCGIPCRQTLAGCTSIEVHE